jgi:hypothetical protein
MCPSNRWKLESLALINAAACVIAGLRRKLQIRGIELGLPYYLRQRHWIFTGFIIAALQLIANWYNALIVQSTSGYEHVPVGKLMLFWCTMPRSAWLLDVLTNLQPSTATRSSSVISSLVAESIFQLMSLYYMAMTVKYGLTHGFYLGRLDEAERGGSATLMYAGAFIWLVVIIAALTQWMSARRRWYNFTEADNLAGNSTRITSLLEEGTTSMDGCITRLHQQATHHETDKREPSEHTRLYDNEGMSYVSYGAVSVQNPNSQASRHAFTELYVVTVWTLPFLWSAQWLFWIGFVGLSSEE